MAPYETDNLPLFLLLKFQESPPWLLPFPSPVGTVDIVSAQQKDGNQNQPVASSVDSSRVSSSSLSKVCTNVCWFKNSSYEALDNKIYVYCGGSY